MKKLLFSLVAAAACGAVTAAPATATFDGATFDPTKADNGEAISESNRGYWEIDVSTDPELTAVGEDKATPLGYLQINTGSTPLWRTFAGVDGHVSTTNAALDAAAVDADGVVVSSDVKLTACTEWPTLTDFANEKLALFLFAPEEGDTSGKTNGLYAVGGAMVDGNLTATAYRLNADPNAITNTDGWATIAIKSYADVYVNNTGAKYPAFVIAACKKGSTTTNILSVATGEAYAPGFDASKLSNAANARIEDRELIPSAKTSDGKLVGLGFQGEGGIDNVSLATTDFAVDAVTMTATITDATVTWTSEGTSLDGTTLTFVPGSAVTFKVAKNAGFDILTVTYKGGALEADENGVYTIDEPEANAQLVVTAVAAKFAVDGVGSYATFNEALNAAIAAGKAVKLASDVDLGNTVLTFAGDADSNPRDITLDLAGKTLTGAGNSAENALAVIMVAGDNLTITDTIGGGKVTAGIGCYAIHNASGSLTIEAGEYNGQILTSGEFAEGLAYINGGTFSDITGLAVVEGGNVTLKSGMKWSDLTEGYYTLVEVVEPDPEPDPDPEPETPEISDENGSIEEDEDGNYVVDTESTEITVSKLPADFTGKVVIPSTVEKIIGVALENLMVLAKDMTDSTKSYDITDALMVDASGNLVLNAEVTVNGVPVKPALADGASETPFVVGESTAATVKTIPGLKYSLVWDSDLSFNSDAKGGTEPVQAKTDRLTLEDTTEKPTKRFYKVKVSK